jgi:hypothetical protein
VQTSGGHKEHKIFVVPSSNWRTERSQLKSAPKICGCYRRCRPRGNSDRSAPRSCLFGGKTWLGRFCQKYTVARSVKMYQRKGRGPVQHDGECPPEIEALAVDHDILRSTSGQQRQHSRTQLTFFVRPLLPGTIAISMMPGSVNLRQLLQSAGAQKTRWLTLRA